MRHIAATPVEPVFLYRRLCTTNLRVQLLSAALLMSASQCYAQTVYRCADSKGQTVYQQYPCNVSGGGRVEIAPGNVADSRPAGDTVTTNTLLRDAEVRRAIEERRVFPGMTEEEMVRAIGRPIKSNHTLTGSRHHTQHVYPNGRFVYTRDGRVTSLHWTDAAPKPTPRCPTDTEMWNWQMDVDAKKYKSAQTRQLAATKLREGHACRSKQ